MIITLSSSIIIIIIIIIRSSLLESAGVAEVASRPEGAAALLPDPGARPWSGSLFATV